MSIRKPGWYWVRRKGCDWEPAEWAIRMVGTCHYVHWDAEWAETGTDADLERIGQRIPAPGEPWRSVPENPDFHMLQMGCESHWSKQRDMASPTPTEFEEGGPMEAAWRAMLEAAPKP